MRRERLGLELGVVLNADEERLGCEFDDLDQVACVVGPGAPKASRLELAAVMIVVALILVLVFEQLGVEAGVAIRRVVTL